MHDRSIGMYLVDVTINIFNHLMLLFCRGCDLNIHISDYFNCCGYPLEITMDRCGDIHRLL